MDSEYLYIPNKKICILNSNCINNLSNICSACDKKFPKQTIYWFSLSLSEKDFINYLETLISNDFKDPFITTLTPNNKIIPMSIGMVKTKEKNQDDRETVLNKVMYSIQQYKENSATCYLYAKFSPKAVKFLKSAPEKGREGNSQKEITGELYVDKVVNKNNSFIYIIDVREESIKSGDEDNVNVDSTRYSFHSHPRDAYIKYSVDKAWPSVTDFLGYHTLGNDTIFHVVAAIEGVYIISFTPYWGSKIDKIDRKFIDKNFEIDHNLNYSPKKFTQVVNKILYKGYPIFKVNFFQWGKANSIFRIYYSPLGISCLPTQEVMERYKNLYS